MKKIISTLLISVVSLGLWAVSFPSQGVNIVDNNGFGSYIGENSFSGFEDNSSELVATDYPYEGDDALQLVVVDGKEYYALTGNPYKEGDRVFIGAFIYTLAVSGPEVDEENNLTGNIVTAPSGYYFAIGVDGRILNPSGGADIIFKMPLDGGYVWMIMTVLMAVGYGVFALRRKRTE